MQPVFKVFNQIFVPPWTIPGSHCWMWTSPLFDRTVLFLYGETLIAHCLSAPISLWLHSSEKQVVPEAPIFLELWVQIFHCRLNISPWKFHRCLKQSRQNWAPNSLTSASPSASHLRERPSYTHLLQPEIWVSSLTAFSPSLVTSTQLSYPIASTS